MTLAAKLISLVVVVAAVVAAVVAIGTSAGPVVLVAVFVLWLAAIVVLAFVLFFDLLVGAVREFLRPAEQ